MLINYERFLESIQSWNSSEESEIQRLKYPKQNCTQRQSRDTQISPPTRIPQASPKFTSPLLLLLLLSHVSRQSCPTLWDPIDVSPPGSFVPGILQPRTLEKVKRESEVPQSCPTPHDPTDYSPPGSSVHASSQARVLEWAAIAFSAFPIRPWLLVDAQTRSPFLSLLDTCQWNDLNHIIKGLVPFSPIPLLGVQNGILQLGLNKIG